MRTPVVLIIFNRLETTQKVFEAIRQAKPSTLLVIADAPRLHRLKEADKCKAVCSIIERVDWNCEILTNFSEVNLGARLRLSSGLEWVFSQVEEAIIFEHDCLPHPTFFPFCEELLSDYRHDERIMHISGNNFQFGRHQTKYSYYFSRYTHIWGWATWRRAWQYYDVTMKMWPMVRDRHLLNLILDNPRSVRYWHDIFQKVYDKKIDTWDYQWTFACWLQNGLTILPDVNLVSNIGFGPEGYYTKNPKSPLANIPVTAVEFPLQHPPYTIRYSQADKFTQDTVFDPVLSWRIANKLNQVITKD